jgi:hypothetical protein
MLENIIHVPNDCVLYNIYTSIKSMIFSKFLGGEKVATFSNIVILAYGPRSPFRPRRFLALHLRPGLLFMKTLLDQSKCHRLKYMLDPPRWL